MSSESETTAATSESDVTEKSDSTDKSDSAKTETNGSGSKSSENGSAKLSGEAQGDKASHTDGALSDALSEQLVVSGTNSSVARATLHIARELSANNVPFLVFDDGTAAVNSLSTHLEASKKATSHRAGAHLQLTVNPLELLEGVLIETHISNLVEIFSQQFELDRNASFVVEIALQKVYERSGWNMLTSSNRRQKTSAAASDAESGGEAAAKSEAGSETSAQKHGQNDLGDGFYQPEFNPTLHDLVVVLHELATANELPVTDLNGTISTLLTVINPLITGTRDIVFGTKTIVSISRLFQCRNTVDMLSLPSERERAFCLALLLMFAEEYQTVAKRSVDASASESSVGKKPRFAIFATDCSLRSIEDRSHRAFTRTQRLSNAGISVVTLRTSNQPPSHHRPERNHPNRLIASKPGEEKLERVRRFAGSEAATKAHSLQENEALLLLSSHETSSVIKLDDLNENASATSATESDKADARIAKPLIAFGSTYCPEAFSLDAYAIGWKVANTLAFQKVFTQYIFSVLTDIAQLVHFRTKVMAEIHTIAGREHGLPTHYISWCALSLLTDKYYEDHANRMNWSLADLRRVRGTWYEMIAPAFLPSIPNRKLNVKIIKNWMDDFVSIHNKDQAPDAPARNTSVFVQDIDKFIDAEVIETVANILHGEDGGNTFIQYLNKTVTDLITKENKEIALCLGLRLLEYLQLEPAERDDISVKLKQALEPVA